MNVLTEDLDKEINKAQEKINNITDNLIGASDSFLELEKKIAEQEEKIKKLENDKQGIKDMAKDLKCRLSPRLEYLIFLRKEISEALVPRLKTPEEQMHILTGTMQRTQEAITDNKTFNNGINLILTDIFQIVTHRLQESRQDSTDTK